MTAGAPPATAGLLLPDQEALRAFWRALVWPGEVHEVRIPHTRAGPARLYGTAAGYFDDAEPFVRALASISGRDAAGVYMTMNPVKTTLLARARNRLESRARATSSDADVTRRRHLLIDLDPVRDPKDISATDSEVTRALARRDDLWHWLGELGWPAPAMAVETGNGGALLYRIALANDESATELVRRVLAALDAQFSDQAVKVDVVNYNAARICKVVGTVAAKGDDFGGCPGEPPRRWRRASATYRPEPSAVSRDLLVALAAEAPNTGASGSASFGPQRAWTMDDLLRANSLRAHGQTWAGGGTKYRLERCLSSPDHTDGAALIEMPSGAIVYRCHHDRCAGKGWAYLKEHDLVRLPQPARSNGRCAPAGSLSDISQEGAPAGLNALNALNSQHATPDPELREEALYGLAGDVVRALSPQTEAHPAALLVNTLVYFGSATNSAPHALVRSKRHGTNLFAVLVGRTSGGRKGTSRAEIGALFEAVDPDWYNTRVQSGLSSGEGLINAVRDPTTRTNADGSTSVLDEGISDKRLLIVEEEFCSPVKVMAREGNTLSAVMRQAWDGQTLSTLVRHSPLRATRPHISVLGHATQPELLKYLTETEMADGFANRFLWVHVARARLLPDGGQDVPTADLVRRLRAALQAARVCTRPLLRDESARVLWHQVYPALTAERPGLFGGVTSRAEAQVLRLSTIYALLDGAAAVHLDHLRAALALWSYCQQSARLIFGDRIGDQVADRILGALRGAGACGLTLTQIAEVLGRHQKKERTHAALRMLEEGELIVHEVEQTDGAPVHRYRSKEGCRT